MNYRILSSTFESPAVKELLQTLVQFFEREGIEFFIIGAVARDIMLGLHHEKSPRATNDLDIAVAIKSWEVFEQIEHELIASGKFTKDLNRKQRFFYKKYYILDIVPFGELSENKNEILWPPDFNIAMSVLGFDEVNKHKLAVTIDNEFRVFVADLAGIFLLKIVAWHDRHSTDNRDAADIGFILANYFWIWQERIYTNHYTLFEDAEAVNETVAAFVLGTDMANILATGKQTKSQIISILSEEITKAEESKLINQIIETNRNLIFDLVAQCLQQIVLGLDN